MHTPSVLKAVKTTSTSKARVCPIKCSSWLLMCSWLPVPKDALCPKGGMPHHEWVRQGDCKKIHWWQFFVKSCQSNTSLHLICANFAFNQARSHIAQIRTPRTHGCQRMEFLLASRAMLIVLCLNSGKSTRQGHFFQDLFAWQCSWHFLSSKQQVLKQPGCTKGTKIECEKSLQL